MSTMNSVKFHFKVGNGMYSWEVCMTKYKSLLESWGVLAVLTLNDHISDVRRFLVQLSIQLQLIIF